MGAEAHHDAHVWSGSSDQPVLQLLVEAVAEMAGYDRVVLSVVLGDDLVVAAHTGVDDLHLRSDDAVDAALRADDGRTVGLLTLDAPRSGTGPDEAQRRVLERCVAQTERAVVAAIEREELREQVGYAETARRMVRAALMPAHASLEDVLEHTHRPLVDGFHALGSWIELAGEDAADAVGRGYARARNSAVVLLPEEVVDVCHELARRLWDDQRTLVVESGADPAPGEDPELPTVRRELAALGLTSALAVPLGAGRQYLGFLALARGPQDPGWSAVEQAAALQIGHDLGVALRTAGALERERTLVRELQQLDDYRSSLIATLSHELRTPLTVISGNLEMLGALDIGDEAIRHHRAMSRGASRMQKVVDDLLLLARVSDPQHPLEEVAVDLRDVVQEVVALVTTTMQAKQLTLEVTLPAVPLTVTGSPSELDRLVGNLVSNAAKYTDAGGTVTVTGSRVAGDVVLRVADTGIGISADDLEGLFRAFFRTSNPDALRQPGTGLGLAIVATIAERHGGAVEVASELGVGTAFTVTLPGA